TMSGLAFQGSNAQRQSVLLYNQGQATLTNCIVSGNAPASNDGGILNTGTLTMTNTTVSGNASTFYIGSGGIMNAGTLTMANSTVSGNKSSGDGGGIVNTGTL